MKSRPTMKKSIRFFAVLAAALLGLSACEESTTTVTSQNDISAFYGWWRLYDIEATKASSLIGKSENTLNSTDYSDNDELYLYIADTGDDDSCEIILYNSKEKYSRNLKASYKDRTLSAEDDGASVFGSNDYDEGILDRLSSAILETLICEFEVTLESQDKMKMHADADLDSSTASTTAIYAMKLVNGGSEEFLDADLYFERADMD